MVAREVAPRGGTRPTVARREIEQQMKPENLTENDAALSNTLRQWQISEPLPPRFREQVWQRIARAEAETPEAPWAQFTNWISQVMSRPSLAASYVTLLLLTGLFAGYMHA